MLQTDSDPQTWQLTLLNKCFLKLLPGNFWGTGKVDKLTWQQMKTDLHVNANYQGKEHRNAYENRTTGLGKMYEPDAE